MELPDIGQHCAEQSCNQLDFLPVKCDACKHRFCNQHWTYDTHNCPQKHTKNVQVPVCPLCDKPVPTAKGTSPDESVSAHLDRDCKETAKRKIKNRCSLKKCKQSEFIKVECDQCRQNFCLKHRHPADHECKGKSAAAPSKAATAALARQQQPPPPTIASTITSAASSSSRRIANIFQRPPATTANVSRQVAETNVNGQLTEDEALARALQASMNEQPQAQAQAPITGPRTREEQDRMLAQAIAESQQESNRSSSNDKSCGIS